MAPVTPPRKISVMATVKKATPVDAAETAVKAALAPIAQMQEKVRETAEKGLEQARSQYEAVKDAAEKATGQIEESMNAAKSGVVALNLKALELARKNANASFDHVQALFGVKTVQDFVSLQTEFFKKQSEVAQSQLQELAALGQKVVTEASEPVKAAMASSMKK